MNTATRLMFKTVLEKFNAKRRLCCRYAVSLEDQCRLPNEYLEGRAHHNLRDQTALALLGLVPVTKRVCPERQADIYTLEAYVINRAEMDELLEAMSTLLEACEKEPVS